jgi:L-rhamnose mutarotase
MENPLEIKPVYGPTNPSPQELEGKKYLFSYFEYTGDDYEGDMRAVAEDPETQRWWKETDPCQIQLPTHKPGANWSDMEMVFLMK